MNDVTKTEIPEVVARQTVSLTGNDEVSFGENLVHEFANALGKQGICYKHLTVSIDDESAAKMVAEALFVSNNGAVVHALAHQFVSALSEEGLCHEHLAKCLKNESAIRMIASALKGL